ncbi:MAG TPA: 23S rRNA (pseudouridine(1915)-N(3))-methyltransferase RlmH [Caulobacteraceae bacterium]
MRITLLCVGRLGTAPEAMLAEDWARRAGQVGRPFGLHPVEIVEVEAKKGGKVAEGEALLRRSEDAYVIACDEHGEALNSRAFAALLARLRDDGTARVAFAIGGADGLDLAISTRARRKIAFGPQTWPHALARAMLAEQLYRAASLMAGQPYHRD